MRIISFYTDDEYHKCIKRLQKSANNFGYEINVGYFPEALNWLLAVQKKVDFILNQYEKGGGPLLYLDADTEIKSKLDSLKEFILKHDISVRERNLLDKYNCGVMGFGTSSKKIIPFLKTWNKITNKIGKEYQSVDQKPFEKSLDLHKNIIIGKLETPYNFMDHDMLHNFSITDAIIYHYKVSRNNDKARAWKKYIQRKI